MYCNNFKALLEPASHYFSSTVEKGCNTPVYNNQILNQGWVLYLSSLGIAIYVLVPH